MQSVEDFMKEFVRSRTESYREWCKAYEPYIERFYVAGYRPFNPRISVISSESERVLEVVRTKDEVYVVTSGPLSGGQHHHRYGLVASGDSWQIASVEVRCAVCSGPGMRKVHQCKPCNGSGWVYLSGQSREEEANQ
jgi:hypothetical protein